MGGVRLVVGGGEIRGVGPLAEFRSVVSFEAVLELVLRHRVFYGGVEDGRHAAGDVIFALFEADRGVGVLDADS